MRFYDLRKRKPANGQYCVVKEPMVGRTELHVFHQPQFYYEDEGFGYHHPNVVSWAPVPEHVNRNRKGWKSVYWGDDLPDRDCECLVCSEDRRTVGYAYFLAAKQRFLACENVIAFMEI